MASTDKTDSLKQSKLKDAFISALNAHACNVTQAVESAGVGRSTVYEWKEKDPEFRKKWEEAEESMIDIVESQLLTNIREGKEASCIFFLKTRGKKRGYVEKQEIDLSGGLNVSQRLQEMSDEDLIKLANEPKT